MVQDEVESFFGVSAAAWQPALLGHGVGQSVVELSDLLAALPSSVQVPHSADLCPEISCVLGWFCPCQIPRRREVSAKHLGLEFPCEVHPERSYPSDLMADFYVSLHVVVQIRTH